VDLDAVVGGHGLGEGGAGGQDGRLGGVDDGGELLHAEHAEVGDGEGAAAHVVGGQLALAGAADQLPGLAGDLGEGQVVGVADHRDHQAAVDGDGDADVDPLVEQELSPPKETLRSARSRVAQALTARSSTLTFRSPSSWPLRSARKASRASASTTVVR
jgi:hypothetical protein